MKLFLCSILLFTVSLLFGQVITPPYYSSFDNLPNDTVGWFHYATSGTDDWEIGSPNGTYFVSAYSNPNAWVTNLDTTCAPNSIRYLTTPFFNLSDITVEYLINFQYRVAKPTSAEFRIEYRKGTLGVWLSLPSTTFKENLENTFSNTAGSSFLYGARNLDGLTNPLDSIQFRFKVTSTTVNSSSQEGWMIDNFEIRPAIRNFTAFNLDTIYGVNENFSEFDFDYLIQLTNEINSGSLAIPRNFYWSADPIFDSGDTLLFNSSSSVVQYYHNYMLTPDDDIPLPLNLETGYYYLFYVIDPYNLKPESDETDNIGMAVIAVEPVYETPYISDFENSDLGWHSSPVNSVGTLWESGGSYSWNIEDPHSGENAWYSVGGTSFYFDYLETPYFDLTTADSNTFCFYYRTNDPNGYQGYLYFWKSWLNAGPITAAIFSNSSVYKTTIPYPSIPGEWDCYCQDISSHDNEASTKFRIMKDWIYGKQWSGVIIDDIYVGPKAPDFSIEGKKENLFSNSINTIDTLRYYFFNSGLENSPTTTVNFYWSLDSLLDSSDAFLGTNIEGALDDTSYASTIFIYHKEDVTVPAYYIMYSIDEDSIVSEMREYNNVGYFKILQSESFPLPYINDFETQVDGWRHSSDLGADSWYWGVPQGVYLDSAFSGTQAWQTNSMGSSSEPKSESSLYTPVFDLTDLNHPIMEFNLSMQPYSLSNIISGNISYSIDGGATWQILDHTSESSKRLYNPLVFDFQWGDDELHAGDHSNGYIDSWSKYFMPDNAYQGRNYRDVNKVVIDLAFLGDVKNIQFRFNHANNAAVHEGYLIDDFKIVEAYSDLKLEYRKHMLVNSLDKNVGIYYNVVNDGNKHVTNVTVGLYLSADSVLSVDDFDLQHDQLGIIKPYESEFGLFSTSLDLIPNYGQYNFLLFKIDAPNVWSESNETNNVDFYYLDMDSLKYSAYPYVNDFNNSVIDGWNWSLDGGFDVDGPRFRHSMIVGEPSNFPSNGNWFTDPMDLLGYPSTDWNDFGIYRLESPAFDLSQVYTANMSFDFICIGSISGGTSNYSGGNMQYSIDGGQTWITLYNAAGPIATNWYMLSPFTELASLNGDNGWYDFDTWTHATYNLNSLVGNKNVRFRYQFSSDKAISSMHMHGFRLDNFTLNANSMDVEMISADIEINASISNTQFVAHYTPHNNSNFSVNGLQTYFYWSTDSILDISDQHIFTTTHFSIASNTSLPATTYVSRPDTIAQLEYYLFYVLDGSEMFNETDELNNIRKSKVLFDGINLQIDEFGNSLKIIDGAEAISIFSEFNGIKTLRITLYDSSGKLVYTSDIQIENGSSYFIPKSHLSNGIYFLNIESDSISKVAKIVKY